MESRAWRATIHGVAKSWTRLSLSTLFIYIRLGHPPLLFLILSASLLFCLAKALSILLTFLEIQLQDHWFSVLFLFNSFIFNWRIITLQYCVDFCHISLYPFLFHLSLL